jgi:uncharacterized membrane protein
MRVVSAGRMERLLGRVLRLGLTTSVVVLAIGLILELGHVAPAVSDRILRVGLLILMATPVARVSAAALEYAAERDWTFLAVTLCVLGVLMASVFAAVHG